MPLRQSSGVIHHSSSPIEIPARSISSNSLATPRDQSPRAQKKRGDSPGSSPRDIFLARQAFYTPSLLHLAVNKQRELTDCLKTLNSGLRDLLLSHDYENLFKKFDEGRSQVKQMIQKFDEMAEKQGEAQRKSHALRRASVKLQLTNQEPSEK